MVKTLKLFFNEHISNHLKLPSNSYMLWHGHLVTGPTKRTTSRSLVFLHQLLFSNILFCQNQVTTILHLEKRCIFNSPCSSLSKAPISQSPALSDQFSDPANSMSSIIPSMSTIAECYLPGQDSKEGKLWAMEEWKHWHWQDELPSITNLFQCWVIYVHLDPLEFSAHLSFA